MGTAVLQIIGRGQREGLTHGSGLVVAAAVDGRHAKAILGQLAGGASTTGLAARRAWLAHAPRRQVLTGAGTGPPAGKKTLATPTVCGRREAERVNAERGGPA